MAESGGGGVVLRQHLKRYEEAEGSYRRALAINPQHVKAHSNLGAMLGEYLQRYEEAEGSYRRGQQRWRDHHQQQHLCYFNLSRHHRDHQQQQHLCYFNLTNCISLNRK